MRWCVHPHLPQVYSRNGEYFPFQVLHWTASCGLFFLVLQRGKSIYPQIQKVSMFHLRPGKDGAAYMPYLQCSVCHARGPNSLTLRERCLRKTRIGMGSPHECCVATSPGRQPPQGHSPATALVRGAMPTFCDNFIQLLSSWVPGTQIK